MRFLSFSLFLLPLFFWGVSALALSHYPDLLLPSKPEVLPPTAPVLPPADFKNNHDQPQPKNQPQPRENQHLGPKPFQTLDQVKSRQNLDGQKPSLLSPPQDIVSKVPLGKFSSPKPRDLLSEQINVAFGVEGALNVEFYLRVPSSLTPTYLGQGQRQDNAWQYLWDTTSTPNGYYFIVAKVTNELGDYWGAKILVRVDNKIAPDLTALEQIKKEVEQKTEEIKKQEEQIQRRQDKTQELIDKSARELKENIPLPPEIKPEIKEKIQAKSEEFKKESQKIIEEVASPQIQERQKQEAKERLKSKIEALGQDLTTFVPEQTQGDLESRINQTRQKVLEAIILAENIAQQKKKLEEEKEKELSRDNDADGVPDPEELRLGTNPLLADSDGDGFWDGDEVKLGFDPQNPSIAAQIQFQDPRKVDLPPSKNLVIEKIEAVSIPEKNIVGLKISGKAAPNSFVTLYIFSLPTIVITKADSSGRFEYILDKSLADGQHIVFAAVTNNLGQIEKKSQPADFLKRGGEIIRIFGTQEQSPASLVDNLQKSFLMLVIALIVFGIGVAFIVIGLALASKKKSA